MDFSKHLKENELPNAYVNGGGFNKDFVFVGNNENIYLFRTGVFKLACDGMEYKQEEIISDVLTDIKTLMELGVCKKL